MTKTKISMKWLVLALLVVIVAGAVALSLSLHARADDYDYTFRVIITPNKNDANAFARAQGWIGEEEVCRNKASQTDGDGQTAEPVFQFENPQLFGAYGLTATLEDNKNKVDVRDFRNLRKYLSERNISQGEFNPEIQIYVLQDVIWCNDNAAKTTIPVLDTYQTLTDVEKSFTVVPLTLHFIGVTDYNDGKMPTMYVGLKSANYSPIRCNVIFDAVNFRGACKATDTSASNPVYHVGYTAEGALRESRCTGSSYFSVLYVEGCTLEVKNGAGIYNGSGSGTSKGFTRIMVAQYTNAYVTKNHVTVNTKSGDQTTIGNVILRSGTYGYVQAMGNGKVGIETTKMTENFPEEEYTDVENLKGYYYDYPSADALAAGDRSDTSRWYEYDYNAGAADAHVVIGGDEVGTCHVDFVNVGHASGETQFGAGAHLVLDVEEGATIKNFRPGPIKGGRTGVASKNAYSLYQFGTIEVNISGGNIDGTGKNKFVETDTNANGFSGVGYNAGVDGYTGNSEPSYGQAHSYINYTVNITGGTFQGSFYMLMNNNTYKGTPAYNACVQHGNVTYNIGNEDEDEDGPVFNTTTFRVLQGSYVIAPESDVELNFNGGTIAKQLWYGAGACVYNPVKVNLNGGYIAEACEGFVAESAFGEKTEVEEPFTGITVNVPVIVTVDGATIGQYYGAKGGTTNVTTVLGDTSAVSVLKSGTIGSVYMFADAGQSGRMGGTDSVKPMQLNWMVLGEEGSDKSLTIGEYYAAAAFYPDEEAPNYKLGMGKLYAAQMVAKTTVYDNLVIDPAAAFTAVSAAGLKKPVYTYTWSDANAHTASNLTWADYEEGDFTGNFYALGNEVNQKAGEYSGKYAVDCVLDVHGFDLETRANDHLFGNVVMRHKLTTDYATGSIYVNIEGTETAPLSLTRLAHPTQEVEVPATETTPASTKTVYVDTDEGMIINGIVDTSVINYSDTSPAGTATFTGDGETTVFSIKNGDMIPYTISSVDVIRTVTTGEGDEATTTTETTSVTASAVYDKETGDLTLAVAPEEGATVKIDYYEKRVNIVNPFLGNVNVSLKYVTLGEDGNQGYIHLMKTMQYRGAVNITLDHCTVNGTFHALSNAAYGEPKSIGDNAGKTFAQITNTLTDTAITCNYFGGAVNCYTVANLTNVLTNVTIGGNYLGGGARITGTVGADGTADSRAGVWGIVASGSRSIGTITNTLTDVTIGGYYVGSNQNAANYNGGITNNINGVTLTGTYNGASKGSGTGGDVVNNINGLDIADSFFGGNETTGTISGTVTTTITKFHSTVNAAEKAIYAGSNLGGGSTCTYIKPKGGAPAIVFTIDPEEDEDFFISGLLTLGSNEGNVEGDIIANLYGGVQYSTRHVILGNRQTSDTVYENDGETVKTAARGVTGNITCNVYGGNWGTMYLGGRNNSKAVTEYSTVGNVTLNLYGGAVGSIRKGYQDGKGCYVNGDTVVNIHTDAPADETIACDALVLRGTVDGVANVFASNEEHPNTPYVVNVIAGDKTLYYASDYYSYADGTTSTLSAGATLRADTLTGDFFYAAPAENYKYAVTCFGETGYKSDADAKGRLAMGAAGTCDWSGGVRLTVVNKNDPTGVDVTDGDFSTVAYKQDGDNATWVATDERPNKPYGTTILMGAKYTVRVLFAKDDVDSVTNGGGTYGVSYKLGSGDAVEATFIPGEGDFADYYYFFVDGISASQYKSMSLEITVSEVTVGTGSLARTLPERTTTIKGTKILEDLKTVGENEEEIANNTKLALAIGEFADALTAVSGNKAVAEGEVEDVAGAQIDAMLAASGKTATEGRITLASGVKTAAVGLTFNEGVTVNFWLSVTGTEITEAAVGTHTLANGELTMATREAGEKSYVVISCACGADDLATVLSLTVNGDTREFNAGPLTYAKALLAYDSGANANLAQAIMNYAYYVDQFAVKLPA